MTTISGQTVLLTGASGGIGNAIARRLAAEGADIILTGRRREALEALATEVGGRVIVADLSDPVSVRALIDEAGEIDILVANAGLSGDGALESYDTDELRATIDVNLTTPIELTRALLPGMRERGRGHLVYISSVSGYVPTPLASLYNATKFGLRGFSDAMRQELHGSGIGVSLVSPGFISDAGMFAKTEVELPPGLSTKTPEEVASAVAAAIEGNRRDVVVASFLQKVGIPMYALFPNLTASIMRLAGGDEMTVKVAEAHRPAAMAAPR